MAFKQKYAINSAHILKYYKHFLKCLNLIFNCKNPNDQNAFFLISKKIKMMKDGVIIFSLVIHEAM